MEKFLRTHPRNKAGFGLATAHFKADFCMHVGKYVTMVKVQQCSYIDSMYYDRTG